MIPGPASFRFLGQVARLPSGDASPVEQIPESAFLTSSPDNSETPLGMGTNGQRLCFQEIPDIIFSPASKSPWKKYKCSTLILRAFHFCRAELWGWWVGKWRAGGAGEDGGGDRPEG